MDDKTLQQYEEAISKAQAGGNGPEEIEACIQLGHAYLAEGDAPKGLTQFEHALKVAQSIGDEELEARLLGLIGFGLKEIGNYQVSLQSFRKSLRIAKKIKNLTLQIDALLYLGIVLGEQGDYTKAISQLDNALMLTLLTNDYKRKLHISNLLGNIYLGIDSFEKAHESYGAALDSARKLQDTQAEASTLILIGRTFLLDEIYDGAIENFELALDLTDKIESPFVEFQALNGLMHTNKEIGKTKLAVVYGEQLVNKAKAIGDLGLEIQTIKDLGILLLQSEKYKEVLPYLECGLEISRDQKDSDWELSFLADIGIAYYLQDDHDQAVEKLQDALDMAVRLQKWEEEAGLLGYLSSIAADKGDLETSIQHSERALKLARDIPNPMLEGEQLVLLALNYHDLGNHDQAVKYCQDAIDIFEAYDRTDLAENARSYLEMFG